MMCGCVLRGRSRPDGTLGSEANRYVARALITGWHTNGVIYGQQYYQPDEPGLIPLLAFDATGTDYLLSVMTAARRRRAHQLSTFDLQPAKPRPDASWK